MNVAAVDASRHLNQDGNRYYYYYYYYYYYGSGGLRAFAASPAACMPAT